MRLGLIGLMLMMSGCIGELWAVRTIDDIQKSEHQASLQSSKSIDALNRCMMQALYAYKTVDGKRPYADVATRDFGTTREITLRTPQRPAAGMYDAGGEILFLIETTPQASEGSNSKIWVHQYMLTPPPKENLSAVVDVVKVCL